MASKRFGYDTRKVQLSSLILTGQLSRCDALAILSKPAISDDEARIEIKYISSQAQISQEQLLGYSRIAKEDFYKDYRSQAWIYKLGAKALRLIGAAVSGW